MFDYLPEVCRELNGNIREIYWILLAPFTLLIIILEFFQMPANPNVQDILKRVAISVIMLISFDECINTIAMIGDGLSNQIHGIGQFQNLLDYLETNYKELEVSWLKLRESVIFVLCIISYVVAYAGIFIANILIHFVWSILYICSPLMILMYVSKKTSFVTANLYKGLINVVTWKILWSILGIMLLKIATNPEVGDLESFLTTIMVNLCIGLSMLFIPLTTKSLISDGLSSSASALTLAPALALGGTLKGFLKQKGGAVLGGTLNQAKHGMSHLQTPIRRGFQKTRSKLQGRWLQPKSRRQNSLHKGYKDQDIGSHREVGKKETSDNVLYPDFSKGKDNGDSDKDKE